MTVNRVAGPASGSDDGADVPVLRGVGLGKHFDGVYAVRDVTLELEHGEVLGLIGPNGSGKSTLLDLLAGIQVADHGTVWLDGQNMTFRSAAVRAESGMARLFQMSRVYSSLTVEENVRVVIGRYGSADEDTIQFALETVGLADRRRHLAGELSYGQQRLLDIARALAMRPSLLLLDEPTAGVHARLVESIGELVTRLARQDTSLGILLIEHNVGFVRTVCSRLMALDDGELIAAGSVDEVLADPKVLEAYYGG